jgi:hypothetical protein
MTDSEAYRATLDRLQRDLAKVEATANKLRAGIVAIGEIMSADALPIPPAQTPRHPVLAWDTNPDTKHVGTMREAAAWAIRKAARPLRVREIYDLLMQHGYPYTKSYDLFRGSMTPTLDRQAEVFRKVEPGLYTLVVGLD